MIGQLITKLFTGEISIYIARLRTAFAKIDRHFGELFGRLFGGGMAHLRLVDSDDLLEAGLEVYASPPGKRMQILSLLSGGEQALTAMALVFAAFLSNPAPICICDEIDVMPAIRRLALLTPRLPELEVGQGQRVSIQELADLLRGG